MVEFPLLPLVFFSFPKKVSSLEKLFTDANFLLFFAFLSAEQLVTWQHFQYLMLLNIGSSSNFGRKRGVVRFKRWTVLVFRRRLVLVNLCSHAVNRVSISLFIRSTVFVRQSRE